MNVKIRNGSGKLVCEADAERRVVVIIREGIKTTVKFCGNAKLIVSHIEITDTS